MNLQAFSSNAAFPFVVAGAVGLVLYCLVKLKKPQRNWKAVATVSKLYVYPIKSARPESINSMLCMEFGVENAVNGLADRSFMLVNENGDRVNKLQYPELRNVQLSMTSSRKVKLSSPKCESIEFVLPDLSVAKPSVKARVIGVTATAIDCGEKANEWFRNLLGNKLCVLLYHDQTKGLFARTKLFGYDKLSAYTKKPVQARFQNFSPVNLVSESSLEELNKHLDNPVSETNFRPNVVVTGCAPYSEDSWKYVKIGSTELAFGKHCNRCPQTTFDQDTGVQSKAFEPLTTMRKIRAPANEAEHTLYKGAPKMAVDYVPILPGIINIGDTVYASC